MHHMQHRSPNPSRYPVSDSSTLPRRLADRETPSQDILRARPMSMSYPASGSSSSIGGMGGGGGGPPVDPIPMYRPRGRSPSPPRRNGGGGGSSYPYPQTDFPPPMNGPVRGPVGDSPYGGGGGGGYGPPPQVRGDSYVPPPVGFTGGGSFDRGGGPAYMGVGSPGPNRFAPPSAMPMSAYSDDRVKRRRSPSPPYRRHPVDDRYAPRPRYDPQFGFGSGAMGGGQSSYAPPAFLDSYRPMLPPVDRGGYEYDDRRGFGGPSSLPPMMPPPMFNGHGNGYYDYRDADRGVGGGGPGGVQAPRRSPPPATRLSDRLAPIPVGGNTGSGTADSPEKEPAPKGQWTDPSLLEYRVPLHYFVMWWRENHPDEVVPAAETGGVQASDQDRERYRKYQAELKTRQLWALFLAHREEPWFVEKYSQDSEWVQMREELKRSDRIPSAEAYLVELAKGTYDDVDFDAKDSDLPTETERRGKVLKPAGGLLGSTSTTLFFSKIPKTVGRKDVEAALKHHDGFEHLVLTDPMPNEQFIRLGWAHFKEVTALEPIVEKLQQAEPSWGVKIEEKVIQGLVNVCHKKYSNLPRLKHDLEQAKELVAKLEAEVATQGKTLDGSVKVEDRIAQLLQKKELSGDDSAFTAEQKREKTRIALDQYLAYLHDGLHTCYYCARTFGAREIIAKRCVRHARHTELTSKPRPRREDEHEADDTEADEEAEIQNETNGHKLPEDALDKRLRLLLLDSSQLDPADYSGKNRDEEFRKISSPLIKQEDANKYRCRQCSKLFKAPEFLHKHIPTKHPELFGTLDVDLTYFANYILDSSRLEPRQSQPASVNDKLPLGELHPAKAAPLLNRLAPRGGKAKGASGRKLPVIPPGGMKEDPRAKKGKVGYRDLDAPSAGDDAGLPW